MRLQAACTLQPSRSPWVQPVFQLLPKPWKVTKSAKQALLKAFRQQLLAKVISGSDAEIPRLPQPQTEFVQLHGKVVDCQKGGINLFMQSIDVLLVLCNCLLQRISLLLEMLEPLQRGHRLVLILEMESDELLYLLLSPSSCIADLLLTYSVVFIELLEDIRRG